MPRRYGDAGSLTFAPSEFSRLRLYAQELGGPGVAVDHRRLPAGRVLDGRPWRAPVLIWRPAHATRDPSSLLFCSRGRACALARARAEAKLGSSPTIETLADLAARWAATASRSPRSRAVTWTRTSSRPSRRSCSCSTAPTRSSTSASSSRSAGCRRSSSSRATRASSSGQPGNIDASTAINVEDVPTIPADQLRALGDIHPLGNPHYWIPPKNARADRARARAAIHRARRRGRGRPTRPAWPRSSAASTPSRRRGRRPRHRCAASTW